MAKYSTLFKAATVAAPVVVQVMSTYGSKIRTAAEKNPELVDKAKTRISTVTSHMRARTVDDFLANIEVLRDQVTYLFASANTPEVAKQAKYWRTELDHLTATLPVVKAMSKTAQKKELKSIQSRIDDLSRAILAATIGDDIEDAYVDGFSDSAHSGAQAEQKGHRSDPGVTGY